jgi:hypothetical protein
VKDEHTIREKAREAVESGKLPTMKPSRTWGGPGSGTPCSLCGEPVTSSQMELEVAYRRDNGRPGLDTYYFHVKCFAVWECESQKHLSLGTISPNDTSDPGSLPPRLSAAPWENV